MDISSPKQVQLLVEALDAAGDAEGARSVCEQFIVENQDTAKPVILDSMCFVLRKLIKLNEWRKVVSPRQFIDTISPLYDKLVLILFLRGHQEEAVREWANKAHAIAEFDTDEALAVYDAIINDLSARKVPVRYRHLHVYRRRFRNTVLDNPNLIRNATEFGSAINASISEMYDDPELEIDPTADTDMWVFGQLLEVHDRLLAAGATKEALELLNKTLETLDRSHDPSFFHVIEKSIARIHIREADFSAAVAVLEPTYFSQAVGDFADIDDYEPFFDTAELLGDCYSKLQNPRRALMFVRDAVALALEHFDHLEGISPLISRLMYNCHELSDQLGYTSTSIDYLALLVRCYKNSDEHYVAILVEQANQELESLCRPI